MCGWNQYMKAEEFVWLFVYKQVATIKEMKRKKTRGWWEKEEAMSAPFFLLIEGEKPYLKGAAKTTPYLLHLGKHS